MKTRRREWFDHQVLLLRLVFAKTERGVHVVGEVHDGSLLLIRIGETIHLRLKHGELKLLLLMVILQERELHVHRMHRPWELHVGHWMHSRLHHHHLR